jgi:hypothetical protein
MDVLLLTFVPLAVLKFCCLAVIVRSAVRSSPAEPDDESFGDGHEPPAGPWPGGGKRRRAAAPSRRASLAARGRSRGRRGSYSAARSGARGT